jgi:hypothetical protein
MHLALNEHGVQCKLYEIAFRTNAQSYCCTWSIEIWTHWMCAVVVFDMCSFYLHLLLGIRKLIALSCMCLQLCFPGELSVEI